MTPPTGSRTSSGTNRRSWSGRSRRLLARIAEERLAILRAKRMDRTIQQVVKPYSPHRPFPKQEAWLRLEGEEALFGGTAGSGKSDAALLAALQYVDLPGYSAAIFRRTDTDAEKPGAILHRARAWFAGTAAKWDEKSNSFVFPGLQLGGGEAASIHFGYGKTKAELADRYSGPAFQFILVEELQQWQQDAYLFLFSRMRRLIGHPVPLRMRSNCNPPSFGSRGSGWIRERFIDHARHVVDGKLYKEHWEARQRGEAIPDPPYFESPPSSEALELAAKLGRKAQGAIFIPAFPEDNPGLDWEDYRFKMMKLDSTTRAQLEKGDWWKTGGGKLFQSEWFKYADRAPPELIIIRRAWDLAATEEEPGKDPDWSAGVKMGVLTTDTGSVQVWILDARRTREDPGGVEKFVKAAAEEDGKSIPVDMEEEPGSAGKNNTFNYASKVLKGWQVHGHRKTGPKPEYWKPLSADAKNGLVYLVRGPWNAEFVGEACALTTDDTHEHDDMMDAAGLARSILLNDDGLAALMAWAKR